MTGNNGSAVFGNLLREGRQLRRLSQLQLAMQAEISQRHLSFLESGRARPSRGMVLQLAQALQLPLREHNRLLLAAGFAPVFPQRALTAEAMTPVRDALTRILDHHEPYPALVVDRAWNVQMANMALARTFGLIGNLEAMWARTCPDGVPNALKLCFHPEGLRPHWRNFEEVAPWLLARTRHEAMEHPAVNEVLQTILRYPGIPEAWRHCELDPQPLPVLAMHLEAQGRSLRLFSTLTTFGTPMDVTADELRVESFFPGDAASEGLLRQLGAGGRTPVAEPPREGAQDKREAPAPIPGPIP